MTRIQAEVNPQFRQQSQEALYRSWRCLACRTYKSASAQFMGNNPMGAADGGPTWEPGSQRNLFVE